jgi:hypothetical protein
MRGDAALRGIPVVILSAWVREWTGHAIGVDHLLGKPFNTDHLLEGVGRYCERTNDRTDGKDVGLPDTSLVMAVFPSFGAPTRPIL